MTRPLLRLRLIRLLLGRPKYQPLDPPPRYDQTYYDAVGRLKSREQWGKADTSPRTTATRSQTDGVLTGQDETIRERQWGVADSIRVTIPPSSPSHQVNIPSTHVVLSSQLQTLGPACHCQLCELMRARGADTAILTYLKADLPPFVTGPDVAVSEDWSSQSDGLIRQGEVG